MQQQIVTLHVDGLVSGLALQDGDARVPVGTEPKDPLEELCPSLILEDYHVLLPGKRSNHLICEFRGFW